VAVAAAAELRQSRPLCTSKLLRLMIQARYIQKLHVLKSILELSLHNSWEQVVQQQMEESMCFSLMEKLLSEYSH
jgi:hypothetical protein